MQHHFVFVDTESYNKKISKEEEILSFKLACATFWNKQDNVVISRTYRNVSKFWNNVEAFFNEKNKDVILFAHNTQFDFKMLNGLEELLNRDWILTSQYVKNKTFILIFQKQITEKIKYTLHLWDTMNYVSKSLEKIGESIGFPKLKVDFDTVSNKDLKIYCQRDTEIIFQFIKKLVNFLEINDLTRLKATGSSLSFNAFRHKFYEPIEEKDESWIWIHNWKNAIKLERESYRGGITDCFKIGESKEKLYKLDINSMYASLMREKLLPYQLIANYHELDKSGLYNGKKKQGYSNKTLWSIYKTAKKNNLAVIVNATVELNEENAYILNNFKDFGFNKSIFAYGKFNVSLCTPELEFIENCNTKITIHEINVYQTKLIFKEFVEFFYDVRLKAKRENNKVDDEFCKLMLNGQYGKWGQKKIAYDVVKKDGKFYKEYAGVIFHMVKRIKERTGIINFKKQIIYLGSIVNEGELYSLNCDLYLLRQTEENAYDSFVAISSFITSYARMMLVKYLLIAERKNVYYCDTDSLFVNEKGFNNLKRNGYISKTMLGLLKIEGISFGRFYAPKFYDFDGERKCKGIKKDSLLLEENDKKAVYEIQSWQRWKTDLKSGYTDKQLIKTSKKESNKLYNKGKIDDLGNVIPFSIKEITSICSNVHNDKV